MSKNIKEMTMEEVKKALGYDFKLVTEHSKIELSSVAEGKTFKIGDTEFIVLEHYENGSTICLTKDFIAEDKQFDSDTNDYAKASITTILDKFASKIAEDVGESNLLSFDVDLTTDDGLKDYGTLKNCKAALMTDVQYRKYSELIEQYPVDDWWWLATAVSTPRRDIKYSGRCVAPGGNVDLSICNGNRGVRAVCIFKSDIFVSE